MRGSSLAGWVIAAALMVAALPALAQDEGPILRPKAPPPKPASPTLLVICDLSCNWKLDGAAKGHIDSGGSATIKLPLGRHTVAAVTDDGLDKTEKAVEIKDAGQSVAFISLQPVRDERLRLKAEHDAKIKADKDARDKAEQDARAKAEQAARDKAATPTLLVICDLSCNWKLDGSAKGRIDAGGSATVQLPLGSHTLAAVTDDGLDNTEKAVEIKDAGQSLAFISLQPVRDERLRLKAEQDAKIKADQEAKDKADLEARIKAEQDRAAQEKAAREKAEQEARDKAAQLALVPPKPAQPVYSTDPAAPHKPGIYIVSGPSRWLVPLEAREFKTKIVGFEVQVQVDNASEAAQNQIKASSDQPEFYFYFDEAAYGRSSGSMGAALSPADFMLLRFTQGDDGRQVASMAKMGFTKVQNFNRDRVQFSLSQIGSGVYKVTLLSPLRSGMYGFLSLPLATVEAELRQISSSKDKAPSMLFGFAVP